MGRVYSRCAESLTWFGQLERSTQACFEFDTDSIPSTKSSPQHERDCLYKQEQWPNTADVQPHLSPSQMAALAAPILLRFSRFERCEDYLACHLFDNLEEMVAFRFLMSYLAHNTWFKRMWTVQEGIISRSGRLFFGPVCVP